MRKWLALLAFCVGISGVSTAAQSKDPRVLLFSHSTGYRHESIEPGAAAIQALGTREKLTIVHSEDPNVFSTDGLKDYDAIIFLSTSTDPQARPHGRGRARRPAARVAMGMAEGMTEAMGQIDALLAS